MTKDISFRELVKKAKKNYLIEKNKQYAIKIYDIYKMLIIPNMRKKIKDKEI